MEYEIRGTHQLGRSRATTADARALWDILADSRLLPQWVPAVHRVDQCEESGEAAARSDTAAWCSAADAGTWSRNVWTWFRTPRSRTPSAPTRWDWRRCSA